MEAIKSIGNHSTVRTPSGGGASPRTNATQLNTQLLLQRSVDFNQNFSAKCVSLTRTSPRDSTSHPVGC